MSNNPLRVAVLDDYQSVAGALSEGWSTIPRPIDLMSVTRHIESRDELAAKLAGCEVVVAMRERTAIDARLLDQLPELRLLITTGLSNSAIDLDAATANGILVSGTGGYLTPTAEHTWALILALLRHVPAEDRGVRAGEWQHTLGQELAGRTLGIVGLGQIGGLVARVGHAFGMDVIAWSQHLSADRAAEVGVRPVQRRELFSISDVVTVHLVLSARSRSLVGARDFSLMKPTSILINTSRGPIIDEDALIWALKNRVIAGAGLDVFDSEPLPNDHAFRSLPNTVVTPHVGYVTEGLYRQFYNEIGEDIAAWCVGEPIRVLAGRATGSGAAVGN